MCDDIHNGDDETKDDIVCSDDEIIQIKEANYGRSDGGSECNINNDKLACPLRNSWKNT